MDVSIVVSIGAGIISLCALGFTLISFWWMNWRKGKLRISPPSFYAAVGQQQQLIIQLPLVFFNDGPTPIVVGNLRLQFLDEPQSDPLDFHFTAEKLASYTKEERAFATQFPVRGREATLSICTFKRTTTGMKFEPKSYRIDLQGLLNGGTD